MDQYNYVLLHRFKANLVPNVQMHVDISRPASDTWTHYTVTYLNIVGSTGSDYLKVRLRAIPFEILRGADWKKSLTPPYIFSVNAPSHTFLCYQSASPLRISNGKALSYNSVPIIFGGLYRII